MTATSNEILTAYYDVRRLVQMDRSEPVMHQTRALLAAQAGLLSAYHQTLAVEVERRRAVDHYTKLAGEAWTWNMGKATS